MRKPTFCALLAGVALGGCADERRSASAPSGSAASGATAGGLQGLRVTKVRRGPSGVRLAFSRPVAPASVAVGRTVFAFADDDRNPSGTFSALPAKARLDPAGRALVLHPHDRVSPGREVRVLLTDTVKAVDGSPLTGGAGGSAISFPRAAPGAVYEHRYRAPEPAMPAGRAATPARPARGTATPAARSASGAGAAQTTSSATAALGAGDDHGDDANDSTRFALGGSVSGEVGVEDDVDVFAIDLSSGADVTLTTATSGDTVLTLYGPDGTSELARNDDDPQGGLQSRIEHSVTQSATHYVEVAGFGSRTPAYTLEASGSGGAPSGPAADDHGGDRGGATALAVGASAQGRIEASGDTDWFSVQLAGGETYELRTSTSGDTVLTVYAGDGATVVAGNDDDPAGGLHSRLSVSPQAAATFYAEVAGYGDGTPDYTLSVREASSSPAPSGAPDPSRFRTQPGTDPWHIDFELRRAPFDRDLDRHGLLSGDAATDELVRERVIDHVLSFTSRKYGRTDDGAAVPGQSWRVSFTSEDPAGSPGWSYSREAVGGRHAERRTTLGVSLLDYGNRDKEDNSRAGRLGVFSAVIFGRDSVLRPSLRAGDRRYLDGSYQLGDGSPSEDRRYREVREVTADWGHALAVVTAHEVGHSVGLEHEESDSRGVMQASISRWDLSDRDTHFSRPSARTLDDNLGRD